MIAVFAGTSEGRAVIEYVSKFDSVKAFVSTDQGASLLRDMNLDNLSIEIGKKDYLELKNHLDKEDIENIVDATHPYATQISKNLMRVSESLEKNYVRFERERDEIKGAERFKDYGQLVKRLNDLDGNVLVTSGSNNMDAFSKISDISRLFVRVMPSSNIIKKCENIGLAMNQIIAIMGPHSFESNLWLMKEKNIRHMVTKESGKNGGVDAKIDAANFLGIKIYTIELESIDYINVCHDLYGLDRRLK